jgi:dTDP-4-dehydrorhamnose 3,5-epimerase
VRRGSPSFGRHVAETLSAENFAQLWIPPGFAHGFLVLSEEAEFVYKCTDYYDPSDELRIAWNDPALAIPWPTDAPLLSEPDRCAPRLAELEGRLPRFAGPA